MGGSLFDRLTGGRDATRMSEDESIRLHISRMLTARQGSVQAAPDYGLPDLNDISLDRADLLIQNCQAIEECITRYEPRLSDVEVVPQSMGEAAFTQGFTIRAMRREPDGRLSPWSSRVRMSGDTVKVEG